MSIAGLPTEVVNIPFLAGRDGKAHDYAIEPPGLSSAKNVEFDELGALRLRKPYATVGSGILGGGTLSSVRKIAVVGDELLAFTPTGLYSWSETLSKWVLKGEHLAIASTEATRFGNVTDQVFADRAQLSGVVVMVWTEVLAAAVTAYLAAYDATTGVVLVAPTSFGAGNIRPRVTALATKIMVTWVDAASLVGKAFDPASPSFTTAGGTALSFSVPAWYDIVKDPAADQAVYVCPAAGGASYLIGKVTASMGGSSSAKALTADGPIALACTPAGAAIARVAVLRSTAALNVRADLITLSTLADFSMDVALGTLGVPILQITGAFRTVADGGQYRCYAFWSMATEHRSNWIDDNSAVGTEDQTFAPYLPIASRAFDHGGVVYLWTVFDRPTGVTAVGFGVADINGVRGQFQNTYYLLSDGNVLAAAATKDRAGGSSYYTGHLPGVALISGTTGYAWAGTERQVITMGGTDQSAYAARAPRDILFTFDSDDARRVVQFGRTAYISGSILLQYDGESLTEVGFMQYPWHLEFTLTAAVGAAAAGVYSYKSTLRWDNARGETERSTTAVGARVTIALNDQVNIRTYSDFATRKRGSIRAPSVEDWRTVVAAPSGAPFYLVTSRDPAATGDNGYLSLPDASSGASAYAELFGDVFTDAILITKEQSPENGDVLPRLAPPGASIMAASDTRLFLAGVPGEPYRVHYSLLRGENEIAAFHGALSFALPPATGAITALAVHEGVLYAFTASACYACGGDGFDNLGGGTNYGPPRLVSSDVGALSHDTVTSTPGGLVFFSRKGWYRVRGLDVEYIGAKVEDYNTDTWVAAQVVESQHQIRVLSTSRMLMFDYLAGQWSEWDQASGKDLAIWRTTPMLLDTAVKKEQTTFTAVDYYMEIVTGWIKPAGLQGFARLRRILVLGQYKADHAQQVKIGFDYAPTYTDDRTKEFFVAADAALVAGAPTQLRQGPSRQRLESFRVFIKVVPAASGVVIPLTYDAVTLVGLALEVGIRRNAYPRISATYKQ